MVGEHHQVKIDSLSNSGDGVGRIDDKVVFVPYSSPEDILKIEITQDKKTFFKAKIIEILKPSPYRINPPCDFFGQCGGCDWQHINYETQLTWKRKNLFDVLKKIALFDQESLVKEVVQSPDVFHYRNRIQVQSSPQGYSFKMKNSHKEILINQCLIASHKINEILSQKPVKLKTQKVELAELNNQAQTFKVDLKKGSELGFRQVNTLQNNNLIEKTLVTLDKIKPLSTVYDLYCGQGNWSLAIQKKYPDVLCIGIDINPINIDRIKNKEAHNLRFLQGPVEKLYVKQPEPADLVIIDPPRAGCDEKLLHSFLEKPPRYLIYISCHPATFARDLKILLDQGWSIDEICPFDMFPQTSHLETWCLLRSESPGVGAHQLKV